MTLKPALPRTTLGVLLLVASGCSSYGHGRLPFVEALSYHSYRRQAAPVFAYDQTVDLASGVQPLPGSNATPPDAHNPLPPPSAHSPDQSAYPYFDDGRPPGFSTPTWDQFGHARPARLPAVELPSSPRQPALLSPEIPRDIRQVEFHRDSNATAHGGSRALLER